MIKYIGALFCALLVLSLFEPITCGRFSSRGSSSRGGSHSSHSYPSSHGLSGGSRHTSGLSGGHGYPSSSGSRHTSSGSHGYPSSGGLSGSGGSHGYPSSGSGLSGGGSKYPSGNTHTYPSSSGGHSYPSSNGGHSYPSSSGGHSYPSSGNGLSGSSHGSNRPKYPSTHTTHTTVHHHYHYTPPARISYRAGPGQSPVYYPVYHGSPPSYVYQYRDSGSKYGTLLTGLALLNLGTLAGSVYANSHNRHTYKAQPGEVCRFAVKKANGDYEETKIDCMLMSSFIYEEEAKAAKAATNSTTVTTTVTNTTVVNITNTGPAAPAPMPTTTVPPPVMTPLYQMLPNGTLVPVNITAPLSSNATVTNGTVPNVGVNGSVPASTNGTVTSSVTVTTTNTTIVNALDIKGKDIQVTPDMECFLIRTTTSSRMKKHVPCAVLQSYANQSLKRNSATRIIPTYVAIAAIAVFALY